MTPKKNNKHNTIKKLSILISQDGLSFCVSHSSPKKIVYFFKQKFNQKLHPEGILDHLKEAFHASQEVLENIEEVNAIYASELYTLVPQLYFNEENLTDYLKFNAQILQTDYITFDELKSKPINTVYIPYTNINNYLFENFGAFTFQHAASVFIEKVAHSEVEKTKVYINVYHHHFDVCIFNGEQLMLCNSYEYHTPEDFAYYLLFCFEQLKVNTETAKVILSGEITKESNIYRLLYKYIRNLDFLEAPVSEVSIEAENLKKSPIVQHQLLVRSIYS